MKQILVTCASGSVGRGLCSRIAKLLGCPAQLVPFPQRPIKLASRLIGNDSKVDRLADSLQLDAAKVCAMLGCCPPMGFDGALHQTVLLYQGLAG